VHIGALEARTVTLAHRIIQREHVAAYIIAVYGIKPEPPGSFRTLYNYIELGYGTFEVQSIPESVLHPSIHDPGPWIQPIPLAK
jgi:hypothetical protein